MREATDPKAPRYVKCECGHVAAIHRNGELECFAGDGIKCCGCTAFRRPDHPPICVCEPCWHAKLAEKRAHTAGIPSRLVEIADGSSSPVGRKDDAAKPRPALLPWLGLDQVVKVLEHGAVKYGVGNWRKVPEPEPRYLNAGLRHVLARVRGEVNDPESGLPHLAHAVCCFLFLLEGFDVA